MKPVYNMKPVYENTFCTLYNPAIHKYYYSNDNECGFTNDLSLAFRGTREAAELMRDLSRKRGTGDKLEIHMISEFLIDNAIEV